MRVERISDRINLEHVRVIGERRGDVVERGHKSRVKGISEDGEKK